MAEYPWLGTSGGAPRVGLTRDRRSGSSSCRRPSPLVTTTPRFTSVPASRRVWLIEFGSRAIAVKLTQRAQAAPWPLSQRWGRISRAGGRCRHNGEHWVRCTEGSVPGEQPAGAPNPRLRLSVCLGLLTRRCHVKGRLLFVRTSALSNLSAAPRRVGQPPGPDRAVTQTV